MKLAVSGFEWDTGNASKCEKQGLSRSEIEEFFKGEFQVVFDLKHSRVEDRFVAVGYHPARRPMLVVFSLREREGGVFIRPISARFMHDRELEKYEKTYPKT